MALVLRNQVLVLAILAAAFGTIAVFTFAKPRPRPSESKMIDFSERDYHSPSAVRRTFLAYGVDLRYRSRIAGVQQMSNVPKPSWDASALLVAVASRNGRGSWGPELEPYDERFDNVLVTYGGEDRELLDRVKAAVAELR